MTLHPQARAVLDLVAAGGAVEPCDQNLAQIRTGFGLLVAMGAGPAEPVADVRDLEIAGPAGAVPVRVYRPIADAVLPVVVFFHGGGWTIGSIDDYDPIARQIANRSGAIVVSVGYRLAPEHPHPAALDDCWAAVTWVAEHAAEVGGDPTRFALDGRQRRRQHRRGARAALRPRGRAEPGPAGARVPGGRLRSRYGFAPRQRGGLPARHRAGALVLRLLRAWRRRARRSCDLAAAGSRSTRRQPARTRAGVRPHRGIRPAARRGRGLRGRAPQPPVSRSSSPATTG